MTAKPLIIDYAAFDLSRAEPELMTMNADIIALQRTRGGPWDKPIEAVRQARREGRGTFPTVAVDADAGMIEIEGRSGQAVPVRIYRPSARTAQGTFLHFHGGGWVWGAAEENDPFLRLIAEQTGLAVASVDYRLAPEFPFPLGPEDCEDAALALLAGRMADDAGPLPTGFLAIGGESAGAHLAVLTLLRLRYRHGVTPFGAANLNAGCFDLSLTPSVRRFGPERLVLNTEDIEAFAERFVPAGMDRRSPDVSPLYADLGGLPPALFTCGTCDPLVDDSLFMASRWQAATGAAELSLVPGGCHMFQNMPSSVGLRSMGEMAGFLRRHQTEQAGLRGGERLVEQF